MTNQDDGFGWLIPLIGFVGTLAGVFFFGSQMQNQNNNTTNNPPPPPQNNTMKKPCGCGKASN